MRWTGPLALVLGAALVSAACAGSDATVLAPGRQAGAAPAATSSASSTSGTAPGTSTAPSSTDAATTTAAAPVTTLPAWFSDPDYWADDGLVPNRLPTPSAVPPSVAPSTTAPPVAVPMPQDGATPPVTQPVPAPAAAPGAAARLIVAPCRVALLADSVGHDLMLNGFANSLNGVGCPITWSRVQRGSWLGDGVAALTAAGAGPSDVIVVLQGYSKAASNRAQFPGLVGQVLKVANGRRVVWTLYGRTSDCSATFSATMAGFNQHLLAVAQQAPNLRLIDYPAVINAHPEYSENRCPHLLDSGSAKVAPWMAAEIRRLTNQP